MKKIAYFTIDDSPTPEMTGKLDYLDSKNIRGIWYCTGENLKKYREVALEGIKRGQIMGNHGFTHTHFSEMSLQEGMDEISRTDEILEEIYREAGTSRPIKSFRFPYLDNGAGESHQSDDWKKEKVIGLQNHLKALGYRMPAYEGINYKWYLNRGFMECISVDCTYDTMDWCMADGLEVHGYKDLPTILARMDEVVPEEGRGLNTEGSNEIVMFHSWVPNFAFTAFMDRLLEMGLNFQEPDWSK